MPMEAETDRTYMEVHEPIYSEDPSHATHADNTLTNPLTRGTSECIAFTTDQDWEDFRDFINQGNDGKSNCKDTTKPPQEIPIELDYTMDAGHAAPQGNRSPWP